MSVENTPTLRSAKYDISCGGCCRAGKRKNGATFPPPAAMCTALIPISISALACSMSLAYGLRAKSLCDQVCVPTVMPAAITCLVISGCQVACSPISKKVAFRHSSVSALSTAGVLPGQGPSSKVKTTSLSRRKSYCLKCSKPKPGPPVVSISTMRVSPMPSGLSHAGMAGAAGVGFACAAATLGAAGVAWVACATRMGAGAGAAGALAAGALAAGELAAGALAAGAASAPDWATWLTGLTG